MCKRIGGFDILKVMAAIMIVFHHYQQITGAFWENGINFHGGYFYFGYLVELYFMISGFLAFKYIEKIQCGLKFIEYFRGKFFRFFPLMFICAIASTILAHLYIILYGEVFWNIDTYSLWTILITSLGIQAGWGIKDPMINSPTWYISVWFLCSILLYFFVYISEKMHVSVNYFFVGIIFIGLGINYYSIRVPFFNEYTSRGYFAFFCGIIIADIIVRYKNSNKIKIWYVICILIALTLPYLIYRKYWLVQRDMQYILTFIYYPALMFLCTSKQLVLLLDCKLVGIIGQISYNVYMWHFPMMIAMYVLDKILKLNINIYSVQTMIYFSIVCFLIGIGSSLFIEKPIDRFIKTHFNSI